LTKDYDEIISHHEMVAEEKYPLQRGMNYRVGQGSKKGYSIFLMSQRKNSLYTDEFDLTTKHLIYEGHDVSRTKGIDPKTVDQPLLTPKGTWTENGKFFRAAVDYKSGLRDPELVKVYEKIDVGVWSIKGFFQLVDVRQVDDGRRRVWKFYLTQAHPAPSIQQDHRASTYSRNTYPRKSTGLAARQREMPTLFCTHKSQFPLRS
jgi:hypothetical protein